MNNIICLKVGKKYKSDYVNNLYYMVKNNTKKDFNFFCFTDDDRGIDKKINCISLPDLSKKKIEGWFYKLALFDPKINPIRGKVLYLDLDIVIMNNIDHFFEVEGEKLYIIEDWIYKANKIKKYNSSVMCWNTKNYTNLFLDYLNNVFKKNYCGDQDFITDYVKDVVFWPDKWCISYKWHECEKKIPEEETKIIVFHGKPKPHEVSVKWIIEKTIFKKKPR